MTIAQHAGKTLTLDPETGQPARLEELAERYRIALTTICTRYRNGLRGEALVESIEVTRQRGIDQANARRQASLGGIKASARTSVQGKQREASRQRLAVPDIPEWQGNQTLTTCPRQGDTLTLKELAERHGHSCYCITKRYKAGKRGEELIESIDATRQRAHRMAAQRRREGRVQHRTAPPPVPTPRELADGVLATREGRLASRLLKHYAA